GKIAKLDMVTDAGAAVDEHEVAGARRAADHGAAVDIGAGPEACRWRDDGSRIDYRRGTRETARGSIAAGGDAVCGRKERYQVFAGGQRRVEFVGGNQAFGRQGVSRPLDVLHDGGDLASEAGAGLLDIDDHFRAAAEENDPLARGVHRR